MRFTKVTGYHRDINPLPFSPDLTKLAPGAMIPPRWVLFFTMVLNAISRTELASEFITFLTFSRLISKFSMRSQRYSGSLKIVFQTEATSGSSSAMTVLSARFSAATVREVIPPPAKGSMNDFGRKPNDASHWRTSGTSQVFPPGYRKGLSCLTLETFTGFLSTMAAEILKKFPTLSISGKGIKRLWCHSLFFW